MYNHVIAERQVALNIIAVCIERVDLVRPDTGSISLWKYRCPGIPYSLIGLYP